MKKIVALLMALSMVLSLAICVNAADVAKGVNTTFVEDENGLITATVKVKDVANFSGMKIGIDFDETKVSLLLNDKATAATTSSTYDEVVETGLSAGFDGLGAHAVTIKDTYLIVNVAASATSQWYNCADDVQFKLYFQKKADATIDDTTFVNYYKVTAKTYYKYETTQVSSNVAGNFGYTVVPYEAPIVEPDKFINDEGANGGVGTITFFGRVGAEWLDEEYGVIVEGKDFFGAKDGDTVAADATATSTTTFTFGDWDGTFEIVMTNITEKGTAGTKTYQFFVGENVTEEATVVVE